MKDPYKILSRVFGHETFREGQLETINGLLKSRNQLLISPTGSGKSLCYQLPSQIMRGVTIVVSPLIALMEDQLRGLQGKGLGAAALHSGMSAGKRGETLNSLSKGRLKLLYVTPERFRKPEFWSALEGQNVCLFVVDEAHCISQWGHDFRPEYSRLGEVLKRLESLQGQAPVGLALTATATPQTQKDILVSLGWRTESVDVRLGDLERPNLSVESLEAYGEDQKVQRIMSLIHEHPGSAIIYFALISSLEKASRQLDRLGVKHFLYHGSLDSRERFRMQGEFLDQPEARILATPAFGLGVNKPNVRLLIHAEVPGSIEAYYQECGRAGRDGKPAHCRLLYDEDDVSIQTDFINWATPDTAFIQAVDRLVRKNFSQFQMEGLEFLRKQMNFFNSRDFRVETAVNLLERWGVLGRSGGSWEILSDLEEVDLRALRVEERRKNMQLKLLELVKLIQNTEQDLKTQIYSYLKAHDSTSV